MADNANRRSNMGRGSIRHGEALLAGLFGAPAAEEIAGQLRRQRTQAALLCRSSSDASTGNCCTSFGACGLTAPSPRKFLIDCSRLGSRLPWR